MASLHRCSRARSLTRAWDCVPARRARARRGSVATRYSQLATTITAAAAGAAGAAPRRAAPPQRTNQCPPLCYPAPRCPPRNAPLQPFFKPRKTRPPRTCYPHVLSCAAVPAAPRPVAALLQAAQAPLAPHVIVVWWKRDAQRQRRVLDKSAHRDKPVTELSHTPGTGVKTHMPESPSAQGRRVVVCLYKFY